MSAVRVLVVGAGISGLATAWWLARLGADVQLWEASGRAGGKIRTRRSAAYVTEEAAALVMSFRPEVDDLIARLGLGDRKLPRSPASSRYLVRNGALMAVPTRLGSMIASPLWSLHGKLRLLAEPFIGRSARDDETVSEFVTRRLGREMLERAMEPYLSGPLASDPDRAEARSVLPRLTALERRYGSLTAGVIAHRLLRRRTACAVQGFNFQGGMSALVDTLAEALAPRLRLRHEVVSLEPADDGWSVHARSEDGNHATKVQHVVLCSPAGTAARIVAPLDRQLSAGLDAIDYAPVGVVHLGFDRASVAHPLDGTGFLVPRSEGGALTGCLWMSSVFPGRAPSGHALLTCYLGGSRNPRALEWDDHRTLSALLGELAPLVGLRADPEMVRIHRHASALPVYHGPHYARLEAMDRRLTHLPGLHLAANYRGGVSVQDRIACARSIATQIIAQTRTGRRAPAALGQWGDGRQGLAGEPASSG